MSETESPLLLRRALRANAVFSASTGAVLALGGSALGPVLGVPGWVLHAVGAGLLPFAMWLWRNARRLHPNRAEAWAAVALDLAWVAGSAVLLLARLWPLEAVGTWAVLAIADFVLLWAVLQIVGLWRCSPGLAMASGR